MNKFATASVKPNTKLTIGMIAYKWDLLRRHRENPGDANIFMWLVETIERNNKMEISIE